MDHRRSDGDQLWCRSVPCVPTVAFVALVALVALVAIGALTEVKTLIKAMTNWKKQDRQFTYELTGKRKCARSQCWSVEFPP